MQQVAKRIKAGAGAIVVTRKPASLLKGSKKNPNPFKGRVEVEQTFIGYVLGTDYQSSLNNTAERLGLDTKAELKPVWHKPLDGPLGQWFSTDKATCSNIYLKLERNEQQVGHQKSEKVYFLDGVALSPSSEEYKQVEKWFTAEEKRDHYASKQSTTQTEMGIDKKHRQWFLTLLWDNVVLIKQGETILRPHTAEVTEYSVSETENVVVR
jgi:hypothetical protein